MIGHTQNHNPLNLLLQELLVTGEGRHYRRMRNAIWLYIYLIAFVNPRTGKLIAGITEIARCLGQSEATVRSWLGHLRKWHYVTVEAQGRMYLFKINGWKNPELSAKENTLAIDNKYNKGRKHSSQQALFDKALPAEPGLLARHIAQVLQASRSLGYFEQLCQSYPREIIIKAFKQAGEMPDNKIKKSRSALFVYLIKKYAQEKQSHPGH